MYIEESLPFLSLHRRKWKLNQLRTMHSILLFFSWWCFINNNNLTAYAYWLTSSLSSSPSVRHKELTDRSSRRSSWLSWGGSTRPLKNRTVSGLGLGQESTPCLSTQHSTCNSNTPHHRFQWQDSMPSLHAIAKPTAFHSQHIENVPD